MLADRGVAAGQVLVAGAFLLMFNAPSVPVALIAAVSRGIPGVTVLVALQTWLQRASPVALLGRVSAVFLTAEAAATMIGAFTGPALGELISLPVAFNAACTLTVGAAILTFCLMPAPPGRQRRRSPTGYGAADRVARQPWRRPLIRV